MQKVIPLEHGKYYHIYNRGINGEDLFRNNSNYQYFLKLYDKYIKLIADTYAWCLMRNHFHLLVRIKEESEILPYSKPLTGSETTVRVNPPNPLSVAFRPDSGLHKRPNYEKQFSHLFNAYAQAYNKMHSRHGGLFETPFRRIQVTSEKYFKHLVFYIHNNPIHHGFVEEMIEYPWSSYLSVIDVRPTKIKREKVIEWFNGKTNLIGFHKNQQETDLIRHLVIE
jgi:putative transposase